MLKVLLYLPFMILAVMVSYILCTLALLWGKNLYSEIPKIPWRKLFTSDKKLIEDWITRSTRSHGGS
jgi:hypothetical protein